jgi:hypothetical protein
MLRTATYRGHKVTVLCIGNGPYHWSYSLDGGEYIVGEDADFDTEDTALRDGLTAARARIDRLYAPGDDAFDVWANRLHG